ncbi:MULTISPECIES: barstar family protein [Micromonospora]|uniref:Barnase inhibitor n=1 Tax=Micromonospora solifontis TaxID=2487138 RepID=A0ABX9WBD6_9ACTN|nr:MULTISPECIES: barstar family protein [Micromonospora]NES12990.1 barstar family protein [Micromonospora sp. PPF5-17B]NES38631.1 barstar family protein [Micromonospora solifontis]NES54915.1 barstar family protein [Micromonospora sp. PPF5-6]RNL94444.1 barnase inhibitor [Micromonospora solifontis]
MAAMEPHLPAWLAFDGAPGAEPAGTVVGGANARTRAGLFDVLATALPLPDHFGRNWDALADVLADRLDCGPLTLVVRDAGELLADEPPAQLGTLLDVLGGVAAGGHHSLRVLLSDRADRLPALRHRITAALGGHVGAPPADPH